GERFTGGTTAARFSERCTMTNHTTNDAIALRDEAGAWYLITPELLAGAQATSEQADAFERQFDDDATGHLSRGTTDPRNPFPVPAGIVAMLRLPMIPPPAARGLQRQLRIPTDDSHHV